MILRKRIWSFNKKYTYLLYILLKITAKNYFVRRNVGKKSLPFFKKNEIITFWMTFYTQFLQKSFITSRNVTYRLYNGNAYI